MHKDASVYKGTKNVYIKLKCTNNETATLKYLSVR